MFPPTSPRPLLLLIALLVALPLYASPECNAGDTSKDDYDYIVVGAGTAGNVIAARLTEDPSVKVLVLEAGVTNKDILAAEAPLLGPSLTPNTIFDWNFTTTAQPGFNGRSVPYIRGRMLGGSSSVNYMIFTRGSSEDYDRFAAVTEDPGWSWNSMQQYIRKNERVVASADGHNTTGQFEPSIHGTNGTLAISLPGFPAAIDSRVLATLEEKSEEFPFNPDMGGGNVLGIGWTLSSIGNGERSSSATAYLGPALSRPNLDVMINAQVIKLLQTGRTKGVPAFRCLEFVESEGAVVKSACAKSEIILSAGSFGTPLLLQLSGIGDKGDLKAIGIHPIVDNPSVGRNLSDHVLLSIAFSVNGNDSFDGVFRDSLAANINQWQTNRTGPLTDGLANQIGFLRIPSNSSIFKTVKDPAPGPNSAHFETIISNLWVVPGVPSPATGSFMSITNPLISPTSSKYLLSAFRVDAFANSIPGGSIKLNSSNPFDQPRIDPNFLSTEFDIFTMIEAVKSTLRFVSGKAWADYIQRPVNDELANAKNDADIESFIRNTASTIFHAVGTASMSPKGAKWGVVDPDLRVKGVDGLRIVDGSVLPYVPNGHNQGPIYLVAERGADLIKASRAGCGCPKGL